MVRRVPGILARSYVPRGLAGWALMVATGDGTKRRAQALADSLSRALCPGEAPYNVGFSIGWP